MLTGLHDGAPEAGLRDVGEHAVRRDTIAADEREVAEVDPRRAVRREVRRQHLRTTVEPERAHEVAATARADDAEHGILAAERPRVRIDEPVDDLMDRAVPADRHHERAAVLDHGGPGQVGCLTAAARLDDVVRDAGRIERGRQAWEHRVPPRTGHRVRDQQRCSQGMRHDDLLVATDP